MKRAIKAVAKSGAEYDVLYGRRIYCYLTRAGATSSIKRQMRRRLRRLLKDKRDDS